MTSLTRPAARQGAPRGLWALVIGGLALIGFYSAGLVVRPSDAYLRFQSDWLYHIAPIAALLLCVIPISRSSGRERLGWISLAFVLLTWDLGDWMFTYYDVRYAAEPPFPGFADVLYYPGYVGFIAAVALLIYPRAKVADRRWLVDALVVMIVAGAASWVYLLEPILNTGEYAPRDAAIAMGYPLLDFVVLVTLVMALYASGGRLQRRAVMLMVAATLLVVADSGYTYLVSTVGYDNVGNPLDPLWIASYLLIGICFVLPHEDPYEAAPQRQSFIGLLLPYVLAVPLMALAVSNEIFGERSGVLAASAVVVGILIVARQFMTLRENLQLFKALERESTARRALLARVVTAQEDERHRVALDLHDGPVQSLSFLGTRLGSAQKFLQRGEADRTMTILSEVEAAITKEVQAARELMMNMRPPSLDERGVDSALRDLATEVGRQSGMRIDVSGSLGQRTDHATESIIYRLAQEALTNVRKHARASAVQVTLGIETRNLVLRVCDDGCGFDMKPIAELGASGQYGLLGMIERVELLRGQCVWCRREPSGTEFVARIPVAGERSAAA